MTAMTIRFLEGRVVGTEDERVVLFDDVKGAAFGPLFSSTEEASGFLLWLVEHPIRRPSGVTYRDPRGLADFELADAVERWRKAAHLPTER